MTDEGRRAARPRPFLGVRDRQEPQKCPTRGSASLTPVSAAAAYGVAVRTVDLVPEDDEPSAVGGSASVHDGPPWRRLDSPARSGRRREADSQEARTEDGFASSGS
ncbi:hypothetical protein GCM10023336_62850 [Streptomyces similanensis]|uniref:Uncharacterized protein n=1 Tax=Streptomyces similanensis TaxID=1274988 RepID=A0ABP9LAM3_9ACTN